MLDYRTSNTGLQCQPILIVLNLSVQSVSRERYAADMRFSDPVVSYASLDGFIFNVQALRTAFTVQFNLLDIGINGPNEIKTRSADVAQLMLCIPICLTVQLVWMALTGGLCLSRAGFCHGSQTWCSVGAHTTQLIQRTAK